MGQARLMPNSAIPQSLINIWRNGRLLSLVRCAQRMTEMRPSISLPNFVLEFGAVCSSTATVVYLVGNRIYLLPLVWRSQI